jgi:D-glycero-alpha-D-manno-heptose-7-phosphate kinase
MAYTGVTRRASEVVAKQLARVNDNTQTLLRMRALVDEGWTVLTGNGPLDAFGVLLHESWLAKRSLDAGVSGVSGDFIDEVYVRGIAAGALGGKLLGAGGGGFLLFFAPPERHPMLRAAMAELQTVPITIDAPGSSIVFS